MNCPFTIIIDSAEQFAFRFEGMKADADRNFELIDVATISQSLGRHPQSFGDYSIVGAERMVAIERKSIDDLQTTLLGFGDGHRERFESELSNLQECCSIVIVEGSLTTAVATAPSYGTRTSAQNAKSIFRSVIALQQDYRVPWLFCDSRQIAEQAAFRFLWRYWEKNMKPKRASKPPLAQDLLANV